MHGDSDEQLMQQYRDGEDAAFEVLYLKHKGPLYRYLLRSCHDTAVAEELFQDVWSRVIQARDRYEPRAKFSTYLYHLAHNRLVDHYRRHRRAVVDNDPARVDCAADPEPRQPEQRVQRQQQMERLLELVGRLPEDQREVFLLHEEAGLALADIAAITGAGQETVKSRLRYAFRKLRDGMQDWL